LTDDRRVPVPYINPLHPTRAGAKKERDANGNVKKTPPPATGKYWMYALPAMFLLSNLLNPPPPAKKKAS
jgi:hypothetical protein